MGNRWLLLLLLVLCSPRVSAGALGDLSDFDIDRLASYARRHARPLVWAEVLSGTEAVIYIGEDHRDTGVKRELAAHIPEFQRAKITALGFEAIGSNQQQALDAYGRSANSRSAILELLRNSWGHAPESYMELLDAGRTRLRLLGLDRREGRPDGFCRLGDDNCSGRDCHMAAILARESGPEARVLVLVGSEHSRSNRQPRHLSELYGIPSKSYRFVGRDEEIGRILDQLRQGGRGVFLPAPRDEAFYDGFILP